MPNWCFTDLILNSEKDLSEFYECVLKWTSKNYVENGFGTKWLGNIVIGSEIGSYNDIPCRGELTSIDLSDDHHTLTIQTYTAWSTMNELWVKLNEKYDLQCDITFYAEEPGCQLFATNDPNYEGYYYVDFTFDDEYENTELYQKLYRYFDMYSRWISKDILYNCFKEFLRDDISFDDGLKTFKEEPYCNCIYICEIEYCDRVL